MPAHFLAKSEPHVYPWERLVAEKRTRWDGVRNFEARNNLRAMKRGDLVLFYHSGEQKAVVGVAEVVRTAYPDPTAEEGDWSAVDLAAKRPLAKPVTLQEMRADKALSELPLLRKSRLSVSPVSAAEFARILKLGDTKP